MTRHDPIRGALDGSAAGLAASVPMLVAMEALRVGLPGKPESHRLPPRNVTRRIARKLGFDWQLGEPAKKAVTFAAHAGFGAAMGAVYGAIAEVTTTPSTEDRPGLVGPLAGGVAWGLAVWAISYAGWLPAAGILPPPQKRKPRRNALVIASHVVWGAVLGTLVARRRRAAASH